jgi:hypothetical protein
MNSFPRALFRALFQKAGAAGDPVNLLSITGKRYYLIEANAFPYVLSV